MFESIFWSAFVTGIISACSMPLGSITSFFWKPKNRALAFLMAFGGGALLAALVIDLVGSTKEKGHLLELIVGSIIGSLFFTLVDRIVNKSGGFLRKPSTLLTYLTQQEITNAKVDFVPRTYLNKIIGKGSRIEVLSGIRRCGKSTLMKLLMQRIKKPIAYFNFEDARINGFEVNDFQKLDEIIGKGKAAYFFDEIQNIASWEIFVRQLHERGEKVYITGSNASLLSKELGTRLTGRHLRHELFPFSFQSSYQFSK
jgi:hypothetical protein